MKSNLKRLVSAIAALLMLVTAFASCSSETASTPTPSQSSGSANPSTNADASRTFRVRLDGEPPSADPKDFNSTRATLSFYNCYETLLDFADNGFDLEPQLAESWEQVDDLTYTYQIRQGVKFSDGTDLTMEDVLFSLNRIKNPETAASMSYLLEFVDSFEQTGEWELTVHLRSPDATWKYVPATSVACIVSKAAVERLGSRYGAADGGAVGTGPYKFDSWTSGTEIVLVKNEYWREPSNQIFDKVVYSVITDATAAALAAQSNQLDYVHAIRSEQYSIYRGIGDMRFEHFLSTSARFIAFNTQKAPFDDVNLRKAVSYAVDKEALARLIGGEFAQVSGGIPMPESMFYLNPEAWKKASYSDIEDYSFDLEKARAALAQSAYPNGLTFTLYAATADKVAAEAIQSMLKEINLTAEIVEVRPSESYEIGYGYKVDENGKRVYDMFLTGWVSDYLDPIGYLTPFYSETNVREGGLNRSVYVNPEVQKLIDQSYAESDDAVRSELMINAYARAAADCPYDSLYQQEDVYAINKIYDYTEGPALFWNFDLTDIKLAQ
jgi:peptide/nickel transport system substrate-binding protein